MDLGVRHILIQIQIRLIIICAKPHAFSPIFFLKKAKLVIAMNMPISVIYVLSLVYVDCHPPSSPPTIQFSARIR